MPRVTPLSDLDRALAARLRQLRKQLRLSRSDLAHFCGVDESVITRVELGRLALKYADALMIVDSLRLNPTWLATGEGDWDDYFELPLFAGVPPRIDPQADFVEVYEREIKPVLQKSATRIQDRQHWIVSLKHMLSDLQQCAVRLDKSRMPEFYEAFRKFIGHWYTRGDPKTSQWKEHLRAGAELRLLAQVSIGGQHPDTAKLIAARFKKASPAALKNEDDKLTVDKTESPVSLPPVRTETKLPQNWSELRTLLVKATEEPGAKARLAEAFGTTRQAVHKWLSGAGAPSADLALRLAAWATGPKQARKQQSPESGANKLGAAARSERIVHELIKSKSSRGKH